MAISNEQVVDSLVSYYRKQGVDLTFLLSNPIFDKLPLEDKVQAIKKYAAEIYKSSPRDLNKQERSKLLAETVLGGFSGLGFSMLAASAGWNVAKKVAPTLADIMAKSKATAATVGVGLTVGSLVGAGLGYLNARNGFNARQDLRRSLYNVHKDPSLENALGVLSSKDTHQHNTGLKDILLGKITGKLDEHMSGVLRQQLPQVFNTNYEYFKLANPEPKRNSLTFPTITG